jgi:hypothetical protein
LAPVVSEPLARLAVLLIALPALLAGCVGDEQAPRVPTGQIDGAVVDELLRPFANQSVYLSQLGWRDSTSRLGGFTFRDVPVGTYTLLVARPGTHGAGAVVDVQQDRITRVILQLLPIPREMPSIDVLPHRSYSELAFPGEECIECQWTIALDDGHPEEVVFEAHWDSTLLGRDGIRFEVLDDRGDVLYLSPVASPSPVVLSIHGDDIPHEARSLFVRAFYGDEFTPRARFQMDAVLTLYYGATKAELFGA